jgi:hypothetical protein
MAECRAVASSMLATQPGKRANDAAFAWSSLEGFAGTAGIVEGSESSAERQREVRGRCFESQVFRRGRAVPFPMRRANLSQRGRVNDRIS